MPASPESSEDPLLRLSAAVQAYAERRAAPGRSDAEFLAAHEELRDLLEPMLEQGGQEAEAPDPDRYLGGFRLLRELGRGGMGVVFEAEEVRLGRRVALKVLPPHLTRGPRQIERFCREAAAAARLRHPGIVQVHGVGEQDGTHFFAMELVHGPTLQEILHCLRREHGNFDEGFGEARLTSSLPGSYVSQALEIAAQIAEAVAAAHEQGVIHRDLKPQNLMIEGGRIRVVDFGLARDLDREGISQSKEIAGTPEYMSPEQALGLSGTEPRSDVYSIGAVLFEMLTLRRPFEHEQQSTLLQAIGNQEAPSLRRFSPRVPRDIEVICRKCLEKSPEHRFASAAQLAADLRRFLRHEPIEARPPGSATRLLKFARRRTALTSALLLALLLPAAGAWFYYRVHLPRIADLQSQRQDTMRDLRETTEQQLRRASAMMDEPGRVAEAEAVIKAAVETCARLLGLDEGPENRHFLAYARQFEARIWKQAGKLGRAQEVLSLAHDDLQGDAINQGNPEYRSRRASLALQLAALLHQLGDEAMSRARLEDAARDIAALRNRGLGVDVLQARHDVLLASLDYSGTAPRQELRRRVAAGLATLDTIPQTERYLGFDESLVVGLLLHARLLREIGALEPAGQQLSRGLEILSGLLQETPRRYILLLRQGTFQRSQASLLADAGKRPEAIRAYRQAIQTLLSLTTDHPRSLLVSSQLGMARRGLAIALAQSRQLDEAESELRSAVAELELETEGQAPVLYHRYALTRVYESLLQVLVHRRAKDPAWRSTLAKALQLQRQLAALSGPVPERMHEQAQLEHIQALRQFLARQYAEAEALAHKAHQRRLEVLTMRPGSVRFRRFRIETQLLRIEAQLFQRKGLEAATQSIDLAEFCAENPKGPDYRLASNFARAASLLPGHARFEELRSKALDHARRAIAQGLSPKTLAPRGAFAVMRGHRGWQQLLQGD